MDREKKHLKFSLMHRFVAETDQVFSNDRITDCLIQAVGLLGCKKGGRSLSKKALLRLNEKYKALLGKFSNPLASREKFKYSRYCTKVDNLRAVFAWELSEVYLAVEKKGFNYLTATIWPGLLKILLNSLKRYDGNYGLILILQHSEGPNYYHTAIQVTVLHDELHVFIPWKGIYSIEGFRGSEVKVALWLLAQVFQLTAPSMLFVSRQETEEHLDVVFDSVTFFYLVQADDHPLLDRKPISHASFVRDC